MLWRVPLDLDGWSCIAILSISLNLGLSSRWFHFFGTWIPRILQFLGQPLTWAFGYWMVSWRMYGCGNPFKHFFFAKYLQHLFATFLFWPRWVFHSYFKFLIIQTLWLLYPCIPSPISCLWTHLWALNIPGNFSRSIPHTYPQIQINTFPVAQRLPCLYMFTLFVQTTPSTTSLALPLPPSTLPILYVRFFWYFIAPSAYLSIIYVC